MTVVDLEKNVPQDAPREVLADGTADGTANDSVAALPDVPRRIGGLTRSGVLSLFGAAASGLCTAVLLFGELAPFSEGLGFFGTAYLSFLGIYAVLTGLEEDGQAVRDRVMTVVLWTAGGLMFLALAMVVGFTAWRGREALPHGNFVTQDMQAAGPLDPLTHGGIAHAMLGTLIMITIALAITVPLGLACTVYLNQIRGRFSRFVRTIVEAMTALPSVVAGLMVYAVWILGLGMQKSGLAAGFAIRSGGTPTAFAGSQFNTDFVQIMPCWGDDDGTVPSNPGPSRTQCQFGASPTTDRSGWPGNGQDDTRQIFYSADPTNYGQDDRYGATNPTLPVRSPSSRWTAPRSPGTPRTTPSSTTTPPTRSTSPAPAPTARARSTSRSRPPTKPRTSAAAYPSPPTASPSPAPAGW
ncbi:hypothetical protein ACGFZQ_46665 [Streptomyces sp. NPDC048254]|uniref:hypothetical protein n=1 Tax=Streptomyces sp. NPDC048254 TaxID=3365525 RepID=UPI0037218A4E